MEDVQDGIKVSIQDGVTEDPTIVYPAFKREESHVSLEVYTEDMKFANPTITNVYATYYPAEKVIVSIATVYSTGVA